MGQIIHYYTLTEAAHLLLRAFVMVPNIMCYYIFCVEFLSQPSGQH